MNLQSTTPVPPRSPRRSRSTLVFMLGLTGLAILVVVGVPNALGRLARSSRVASKVPGGIAQANVRSRLEFKKARLLADARTLAAVVRYLLESESPSQTNLVAANKSPMDLTSTRTQLFLSLPAAGSVAVPAALSTNLPARI